MLPVAQTSIFPESPTSSSFRWIRKSLIQTKILKVESSNSVPSGGLSKLRWLTMQIVWPGLKYKTSSLISRVTDSRKFGIANVNKKSGFNHQKLNNQLRIYQCQCQEYAGYFCKLISVATITGVFVSLWIDREKWIFKNCQIVSVKLEINLRILSFPIKQKKIESHHRNDYHKTRIAQGENSDIRLKLFIIQKLSKCWEVSSSKVKG